MTLQEAMEGLNRQQRRKLEHMVSKKHMSPEQARTQVLLEKEENLPTNTGNVNTGMSGGQRNRTTFIRKSN